ncbi:MAG: hypothetical protein ACW987_07020 [Candidatus Thorarchaeota archaeon]|jgi:myosin heavy subunit
MEKTIIKKYKLEFAQEDDEQLAEAAIAANRSFNYLKFILTDDEPNANKQRIPQEEFASIIKSGFYTPLKMAEGRIEKGHEDSLPLGVVTHLAESGKQIRGLAALWSEERPEDVKMIKEAYAEKRPINISWELMYTASSFDEDGTENLHDVSLRAATIVAEPAYEGRTIVTQVASKNKKEDDTLDELEKTQKELEDTQELLSTAQKELDEVKEQLKELEGQSDELETLRQFKASIDEEVAKEKALDELKEKFSEAGVEKDEEYFAKNAEKLLSMDEDTLEFILQEFVAFAEKEKGDDGDDDPPLIPNARNKKEKTLTPIKLAEELKADQASKATQ